MLTLNIKPVPKEELTDWLETMYVALKGEMCKDQPKLEAIGETFKGIFPLYSVRLFEGAYLQVNDGMVIPEIKELSSTLLTQKDWPVSIVMCLAESLTKTGETETISFNCVILKGSEHPRYLLRPFDESLPDFELTLVYKDDEPVYCDTWGLPDIVVKSIMLCRPTYAISLPTQEDGVVNFEDPLVRSLAPRDFDL